MAECSGREMGDEVNENKSVSAAGICRNGSKNLSVSESQVEIAIPYRNRFCITISVQHLTTV